MKMRVPSIPLFNIDSYFSVWSHDTVNTRDCIHWTGSRNTIRGTVRKCSHQRCHRSTNRQR